MVRQHKYATVLTELHVEVLEMVLTSRFGGRKESRSFDSHFPCEDLFQKYAGGDEALSRAELEKMKVQNMKEHCYFDDVFAILLSIPHQFLA